jgi:hypothetical protein
MNVLDHVKPWGKYDVVADFFQSRSRFAVDDDGEICLSAVT